VRRCLVEEFVETIRVKQGSPWIERESEQHSRHEITPDQVGAWLEERGSVEQLKDYFGIEQGEGGTAGRWRDSIRGQTMTRQRAARLFGRRQACGVAPVTWDCWRTGRQWSHLSQYVSGGRDSPLLDSVFNYPIHDDLVLGHGLSFMGLFLGDGWGQCSKFLCRTCSFLR